MQMTSILMTVFDKKFAYFQYFVFFLSFFHCFLPLCRFFNVTYVLLTYHLHITYETTFDFGLGV